MRAAGITITMRRQPYHTRETAAVTTIKIRVQLSTLTHKIDRPQPFSQETRQQCKTAVITQEVSRGPTKEKAAVRSQKEDSREYFKREVSGVRWQPLSTQKRRSHEHHKREGSLGSTKESSPLSPPQKRI